MIGKTKGSANPEQIIVYICRECGADAVTFDRRKQKGYCNKHKPTHL